MDLQEQHSDESRAKMQKMRWLEWLGGNQISKRLMLALGFLALLTCFLHFREVRIEFLEMGASAPRFVISQTNFDFLDEEASLTLKQEATRDIGSIYKIDENQLHSLRSDFENSIIENQKWWRELKRTTFEEIYLIFDSLEEICLRARFSDERTLQRMQKLDLSGDQFFALDADELSNQPVKLSQAFWESVKNQLVTSDRFYPETVEFLVGAFSRHLWALQEDYSLERSLRQQVQNSVPERYTHVEAGAQIIKKGEKVSERHFAMLRAMKNALSEARNRWNPLSLLGSFVLALAIMVVSVLYLHYYHRSLLKSLQKTTLLVTVVIASLLLAKGAEHFLIYEKLNLSEVARFPLLLPFASLLICVLIGSEIAMIASFFLLVIMSVSLAFDVIPFLILNYFASIVTILFARTLHKRKQVFAVLGKVWLCTILFVAAFNLIAGTIWHWNVVTDSLTTFVFLSVSALLAVGLLPILESLFEVMTDMTLMEYMDPDHELLRRLSLEAPGTYQHCLVVGNLAETAARAIGANGLFCRVSTLYHDIGKLFNPHYFTENQLGGFNIHQLLTPSESTHVIIAHVAEGETLARKHRLPQSFVDIIREHHGTTMVYYFYCKQIEQMGGDASKVSEKLFRYPGPKPRSKESAIIMIADTIEAASRSMEELTEASVTEMVDKLVSEKADDGQFDDCQLTFEELGQVKRAIVKALMVSRHLRVKYPERR